MDSGFTKMFVPKRLLLGIGLVVVGGVTLALLLLFAERVSLRTLISGPFFILLGVAIAFTSNADACATCRDVLAATETAVLWEFYEQVRAALVAAEGGAVEGVLTFEKSPFPALEIPIVAIELDYCPTCKALGRITCYRRRPGSAGDSATNDPSPPVVLRGAAASRVLEMIAARNTAWQKVAYSSGGA
ncbi:MAG TPA: hypothetical protein VGI39_43260 [Polyangiaceae bacterium]|jgi:hypothetical protein